MEILDKLIQFRTEKGIYKKEIANYLGVTELTMCRYESKNRQIPFNLLVKYADYLGFELKLMVK